MQLRLVRARDLLHHLLDPHFVDVSSPFSGVLLTLSRADPSFGLTGISIFNTVLTYYYIALLIMYVAAFPPIGRQR